MRFDNIVCGKDSLRQLRSADFDSPLYGAVGFLSVASFVIAYLIPDFVVIISFAVAARDICGCIKTDVPPTTVAIDVERKDLRLPTPTAPDGADSLIDSENATTSELKRRKRTNDRTFDMVGGSINTRGVDTNCCRR